MLLYLNKVRNWHLAFRVALTVAALLGAFAFQIPVQREVPGEPFLLFLLIVIAAGLTFGEGVGLFSAVLSALLSVFFVEPVFALGLSDAADFVRIELYTLIAVACAIGFAGVGSTLLAAHMSAEKLADADQRKSVLLKEVAHRVANNFAAVATLIRVRSGSVDDARAKSVLDDALNQVMVMARIHKRLQAGSGEATLDSEAFIRELCEDLARSTAHGHNIAIETVADSQELSLAQAVPLGLILNELVTNAVKYAFPDGRPGLIRVTFAEVAGLLNLTVEDNGVGMSGECKGSGLGYRLTTAIAEQLGGGLSLKRCHPGSIASLRFPLRRTARREHTQFSTVHF